MRFRLVKAMIVAAAVGAAAIGVSYVTTPLDVLDVKLASVEGFRLKDVAALNGQAAAETPVFEVRFSTTTDFVVLANQLDTYNLTGRVLVGDGGCNPDLEAFGYTNVAEMLIDYTRLYDEAGAVDGRGLWSRDSTPAPHTYRFYFGVDPARFDEYVYLGLDEAPLCFEIAGPSRTGRWLYSNIVLLPRDVLAKAAAPLEAP
jgi:hypothetical protein